MSLYKFLLLLIVFTGLILASCARSVDKSRPNPTMTNDDEGDSELEEGYGSGMGAGDTEYENKMYKESVIKIHDVAKLEKFPVITDLEQFKESCTKIDTPVKAVLHLFNALQIYFNSEDGVGTPFLKEIISPNFFVSPTKIHPMIVSLFQQVKEDPRILNSYLGATKPDYVLAEPNMITVAFYMSKNYQMAQNKWKIFVKSSGKEAHTSIVVEIQNGKFIVSEFNEIFTKLSD